MLQQTSLFIFITEAKSLTLKASIAKPRTSVLFGSNATLQRLPYNSWQT